MVKKLDKTPSLFPIITASDLEGEDFIQAVMAAYNRAGLSGAEAQRVNRYLRELSGCVADFIFWHRSTDKFSNQRVESNRGYVTFRKPKSLPEQCEILQRSFPGLGSPNLDLLEKIERREILLPFADDDGWFAFPDWTKNPHIFGKTHGGALQTVLDKLKESRDGAFQDHRRGKFDGNYFRRSDHAARFIQQLSREQGSPDILIVPAQFGFRHRGKSDCLARVDFAPDEFGLGAVEVGCMILTNPERFVSNDDLWASCLGDEFSIDSGGFTRVPFFHFNYIRLEFGARVAYDNQSAECGGVSGSILGLTSGESSKKLATEACT